ncbi:MAG TPA: prenyltransferase [Syntrophales bacterium]|nr:prenyltransferase [Syntrophales bacterium]
MVPSIGIRIFAWIRVSRLQFFPMAFAAYSLGAAAAWHTGRIFSAAEFAFGYLILFLIELASIWTNEIHDQETDRLNVNYSMFTGGSRMLVEKRLLPSEVRNGIRCIFVMIFFATLAFFGTSRSLPVFPATLLILTGLVLGIGYTAPPLKVAYRGGGEFLVGFTHSQYLILCGYVFQGGPPLDALPWGIGVPLFLAVLSAIILAGVPDYAADLQVRKRTVAVICRPRTALFLSATAAVAAAPSLYFSLERLPGIEPVWIGPVLFHGLVLVAVLLRTAFSGGYDSPMKAPLSLSLSYIMWFGIVPLAALSRWMGS